MMKCFLESAGYFSRGACLFLLGVLSLSPALLNSCSSMAQEPAAPARKVYAPGEIRADDVEYIALCEVGLREGQEVNFRSNGVIDRDGLYYVSVVARPYRPDGSRMVVVDETGAIVKYSKGSGAPVRSAPKAKPATPPVKEPAGADALAPARIAAPEGKAAVPVEGRAETLPARTATPAPAPAEA